MKRIFKIISSFFIICLIPFSMVAGQEKKNEQKIKIVIDDGSGKKVVIDTLMKDGEMKDSITLKDGNVIFIGHPGKDIDASHSEGSEQIVVTVSSDVKDTEKVVKEITIVSSDSAKNTDTGKHSKMYVYSFSEAPEGVNGGHYKVITSTSKDEGDKGDRIIYINEGNAPERKSEKTFDVYVTSDNKESSVEKTRYIIAKDGMVVTVEGNDEIKVKELVKEIENKLDVKSEGVEKKETVEVETQKIVK